MRDIALKNLGDDLDSGDFNSFNEELENIVRDSDQTLDAAGGPNTDLNMLSKAASAYANAGSSYQDSGVADAYVLAIASNLQSVTKYYSNMTVTFKAGATNTGASTVNISGLGVKSITDSSGVALVADVILVNDYIKIVYNLSDDRFELETYKNNKTGVHGVTGDVVGETNTQTLTNKTIAGDDNTITEVDSISDQGTVAANGIAIKVIEIGVWNMDSTVTVTVAHGLTLSDILSVNISILADTSLAVESLFGTAQGTGSAKDHGGVSIGSTLVELTRVNSGAFDNTAYNDAVMNRGYIVIFHKA